MGSAEEEIQVSDEPHAVNVHFSADPAALISYAACLAYCLPMLLLVNDTDAQVWREIIRRLVVESVADLTDWAVALTDANVASLRAGLLAPDTQPRVVAAAGAVSPVAPSCFVKRIAENHLLLVIVTGDDMVVDAETVAKFTLSWRGAPQSQLTAHGGSAATVPASTAAGSVIPVLVYDVIRDNIIASPNALTLKPSPMAAELHRELQDAYERDICTAIFVALQRGLPVHPTDIMIAIELCERSAVDLDITDIVLRLSGPAAGADVPTGCESSLAAQRAAAQARFQALVQRYFLPVPHNEVYFYRRSANGPGAAQAERDGWGIERVLAAARGGTGNDGDGAAHAPATSAFASAPTASGTVKATWHEQPLFVRFDCFVRLRQNRKHVGDAPVATLPTSLSELQSIIEQYVEPTGVDRERWTRNRSAFGQPDALAIHLHIVCLTISPGDAIDRAREAQLRLDTLRDQAMQLLHEQAGEGALTGLPSLAHTEPRSVADEARAASSDEDAASGDASDRGRVTDDAADGVPYAMTRWWSPADPMDGTGPMVVEGGSDENSDQPMWLSASEAADSGSDREHVPDWTMSALHPTGVTAKPDTVLSRARASLEYVQEQPESLATLSPLNQATVRSFCATAQWLVASEICSALRCQRPVTEQTLLSVVGHLAQAVDTACVGDIDCATWRAEEIPLKLLDAAHSERILLREMGRIRIAARYAVHRTGPWYYLMDLGDAAAPRDADDGVVAADTAAAAAPQPATGRPIVTAFHPAALMHAEDFEDAATDTPGDAARSAPAEPVDFTLPFWVIWRMASPTSVRMYLHAPPNENAAEVMALLHQALLLLVHRLNQIVLLRELLHTHATSPLLLAPDTDTAMDVSERTPHSVRSVLACGVHWTDS